jgi:hypothetical protein
MTRIGDFMEEKGFGYHAQDVFRALGYFPERCRYLVPPAHLSGSRSADKLRHRVLLVRCNLRIRRYL